MTYIIIIIVVFSLPVSGWAQSTDSTTQPNPYGNLNPSIGVVVIALMASLFFMGFFYIMVRHCCNSTTYVPRTGINRAIAARSRRAQRGLDVEVIESFPTFDYSAVKELKIGKGALECAVCLNEFEDDDTLRLIPKCDHVFHPECIDAWLVAHTTCPVCRSDLKPNLESSESQHAPLVNDVVLGGEERVMDENNDDVEEGDSMEQPLHRDRTMRSQSSIGRSRWLKRMRLARSFSTGHVAVKQWENMDRFTLRLPGEIREQLMSGKLVRSTSMVVLPRETSTRRTGYQTGFEGSSRGRRFGSLRFDRDGLSSGWVFSLVPPFISRAPSVKSATHTNRLGSLRGSLRSGSTRLPI